MVIPLRKTMDKRQFERVHFLRRVKVATEGDVLETHCMDISLRGLLLVRPERVNWRLEQQLVVTLELSDDQVITMNCSLVHIDEDVVGCACDSMDLDSMTTLRRLLELNMPDPSAVDRELAELIRHSRHAS
ncbi:MAG: PilZ domain-containing protein [Oceanospirillaceae bacterium]|nr:PilZ domain-containing protein [Oceanospirillaceae bacterium]MAX98930.1 PilZ domain-containing protein [Oceanospirillaceae bacterium]MBL34096.1 PilZ domain-containing protein [Oceanospirillaceae bacterium]MBS54075.1 PilZ domain-containing protein [Oceanospirillaceae bacterium]